MVGGHSPRGERVDEGQYGLYTWSVRVRSRRTVRLREMHLQSAPVHTTATCPFYKTPNAVYRCTINSKRCEAPSGGLLSVFITAYGGQRIYAESWLAVRTMTMSVTSANEHGQFSGFLFCFTKLVPPKIVNR